MTLPFDEEKATQICVRLTQASTLEDAAKYVGISDEDLAQWRARHPSFEKALRKARSFSADHFLDKMIKLLKGSYITKDEAAEAKIKIDGYKWLAERLNPEHYGAKSEAPKQALTGPVAPSVTIANSNSTGGKELPAPVVEVVEPKS